MAATRYTLYHHPYSICSIMVRYTYAVAGHPKDPSSAMELDEQVLDIMKGAQLEEHFLVKVNPKGQVPALTSSSLDTPITDSLDITYYIAERYPTLMPSEHKQTIIDLLGELHDINYFSLSFGDKPDGAKGQAKAIRGRMEDPAISPEYRRALEYKLSITNDMKVDGVQPDIIKLNEKRASAFSEKCEHMLLPGQTWLFGTQLPTALDAHLVVFLARMKDLKRTDLVPGKLGEYLERATNDREWLEVMKGRTSTMVGG
ncbi:hypothetical protein LTR86_001874 [Recurvomyces mirabilis]|nr:hypothetical protein LTR86_001874 [Recurvomyces mirabilis]